MINPIESGPEDFSGDYRSSQDPDQTLYQLISETLKNFEVPLQMIQEARLRLRSYLQELVVLAANPNATAEELQKAQNKIAEAEDIIVILVTKAGLARSRRN